MSTFTINRAALEKELSLLQVVAEKKSTMPALSTVRMQVAEGLLTLTATDIDMTLTTQVAATGDDWTGCLPSKQLYELTRLFNGESIEFQVKDSQHHRVAVKWGKSKHLLPYMDVDQFPQIHQSENTYWSELDGPQLRLALDRALRCITSDALEGWMQGVCVRSYEDELHVAGTNSKQFGLTTLASSLKADVLIPVRAVAALTKLLGDGSVTVGVSTNQMIFAQGQRTFSTRLMDVKFPDWRPLLPATFQHELTLQSEAAQQAFKLASVTACESSLIHVPLKLTLSKEEMVIETRDSDRGYSCETLAVQCSTLNGDNMVINVNGAHLIGFFSNNENAVLSFTNEPRLFQLSPAGEPSYRYITMTLKT